jgi:hypothetical protein
MPFHFITGIAAALGAFALVGTLTALWPNPLFARSLPVQGFEVALLALQSLLIGAYVAVRRPHCPVRKAGLGSALAFLGVACPTCNQLLLLVFGADLLAAYFEPARLYVALAGVLVTAIAVWAELRPRRASPRGSAASTGISSSPPSPRRSR